MIDQITLRGSDLCNVDCSLKNRELAPTTLAESVYMDSSKSQTLLEYLQTHSGGGESASYDILSSTLHNTDTGYLVRGSGYTGSPSKVLREDGSWITIPSSSYSILAANHSQNTGYLVRGSDRTSNPTRFLREDGTWVNIDSTIGDYLPLTGGTVTGNTWFTQGLYVGSSPVITVDTLSNYLRTINGISLVGTGDISISGGSGGSSNVYSAGTGLDLSTSNRFSLKVASDNEIGGVATGFYNYANIPVSFNLDISRPLLLNSSNKGYVKFPTVKWGSGMTILFDSVTDSITFNTRGATYDSLGSIMLGYNTSDTDRNYAVLLDDDNRAYVHVPWSDTVPTGEGGQQTVYTFTGTNGISATNINNAVTISLNQATRGVLGGIKTGYTTSSDYPYRYAVSTDATGNAYVDVPWEDLDTQYTFASGDGLSYTTTSNPNTVTYNLEYATTRTIGGIKLGYTENGYNYPVKIDSQGNAYVNVQWGTTVVPEYSLSKDGNTISLLKDSSIVSNVTVAPPTLMTATASAVTNGVQVKLSSDTSGTQYLSGFFIKGDGDVTVSRESNGGHIVISATSSTGTTYTNGVGLSLSSNEFSLNAATTNTIGGIKVGTTANPTTIDEAVSGTYYRVQKNNSDEAFVRVPGYSAGDGLSLSDNVFSLNPADTFFTIVVGDQDGVTYAGSADNKVITSSTATTSAVNTIKTAAKTFVENSFEEDKIAVFHIIKGDCTDNTTPYSNNNYAYNGILLINAILEAMDGIKSEGLARIYVEAPHALRFSTDTKLYKMTNHRTYGSGWARLMELSDSSIDDATFDLTVSHAKLSGDSWRNTLICNNLYKSNNDDQYFQA